MGRSCRKLLELPQFARTQKLVAFDQTSYVLMKTTYMFRTPPHRAFIQKVTAARRKKYKDIKRQARHFKIVKTIASFFRGNRAQKVLTIANLTARLNGLKKNREATKTALDTAVKSLKKARADLEEALKVIAQCELDDESLTNTIADHEQTLVTIDESIRNTEDKIALLTDSLEQVDGNNLFFFANLPLADIREKLDLQTEDDLNKKVDNPEWEPLLKGLQEAGMEYHADVVKKNITIETSHGHGPDSFKKQVAAVLGIPLTEEDVDVTANAKRDADAMLDGDDDGDDDEVPAKPAAKKPKKGNTSK